MTDSFKFIAVSLLCGLFLFGSDALGQKTAEGRTYNREFCSDSWSNGDRSTVRDLREFKVGPGAIVVDGKLNGGIAVRGEDRSDVLVKACVQAWGDSDAEAQALAKSIRVDTAGTIQADGEGKNWSVSYQILVPRNTDLNLKTLNGGISIVDVEGRIEFEAKNGGISLSNLAGDVQGRTSNGGVSVKLGGNSWRGNGLNVETTNGGVSLLMSETYAAKVEAGTVNGGFASNIPGLTVEKSDDDRWGATKKRVTADLNGGGAPIRVVTTNGGVSIKAAK